MMPDAVDRPFNPPKILDAGGRPARASIDTACPSCHAPKERRRLSSGFGAAHDICGDCGYDFEERTIWPEK